MVTVYPLMAGLHAKDSARLIRTAERSSRYLVVAVGLPVTIAAVAGADIMRVLFGEAFVDAGHLLSILAFMALLGATGTVIVNLLIAVHLEARLMRNTAIFAIVGTVLSFVAIHRFGQTGAAVAMLATSLASQILAGERSGDPGLRSPGPRCRATRRCGCLSRRRRRHVGRTSPVAAAGIAVAVYAVTLVVLGVANRDELDFVRSAIAAARSSTRG